MYKKFLAEHLYHGVSIEEIRLRIFVEDNNLDLELANALLSFYSIEQVRELIIIPDFYYRILEFINPTYSSTALGFIRDLVYFDYDPYYINIYDLNNKELDSLRRRLKLKNMFEVLVVNKKDINNVIKESNIEETTEEEIDFDNFDNLFEFLDGGNSTFDIDDLLDSLLQDEEITDEEYYLKESSVYYFDFLYSNILKNAILLSPEDEKAIFDKVDEREYYERFLNGNLRLAVHLALRYSFFYPNMQKDLIQVGFIGLMNAMKRFDSSLGYKFSTFATHHVKQQMNRFVQDHQSTIRIPVHKREELFKYTYTNTQYKLTNNAKPSMEFLAKELNISFEDLQEEIRLTNLSNNFSDLEKEDLVELFDSFSYDPTTEHIYLLMLKEEVLQILKNTLSAKEYFVLAERYGFNSLQSEKTLEEVGAILGVTRERIRQIQAKALRKLRNKKNLLELFDIMNEQRSGD